MDIEYNVPEWDEQDVRIVFEEEGAFTGDSACFVDGRQTEWCLTKQ